MAVLQLLRSPRNLLTALSLLCLIASWVTHWDGFAYASFVFGGAFSVWGAIETLLEKRLDVDVLMVIAAIGSVVLNRPQEGAILFFLFSLSHALEHYTMDQTKSAIEGLVKLRPAQATVLRDNEQVLVPVEEIALGETLYVAPQSLIPLDADVLDGITSVDQSAVSGESAPVSKLAGDKVIGGTFNLEGRLVLKATATIENSTLTKIMNLVSEAQENKASGERVSAWFGSRYPWFVLSASLALYLFKYFTGHENASYAALTLLVALSPCALVISTPASTLSALAWAAKNGMLIRGGRFIEMAGQVDSVAMDKTGTLTQGKLALVEICLCDHELVASGASECDADGNCWKYGQETGQDAQEILSNAAAIETQSDHPIATAIFQAARSAGLTIPQVDSAKSIPGKGIVGTVNGQTVAAGKISLFEEIGVHPSPSFVEHADNMAANGMTVALLYYGGKFAALGLRDEPRKEALETLKILRELGVKNIRMLTGDNVQTARAVAAPLGLEGVEAGLMPQDKAALIAKFASNGERVMMVGDGVNDAPSLAGAHIGVAMGGLGSDIALNSADVVLVQDNLKRIPDLIRLGRRTKSVIQTNLIFAAGVIAGLSVCSLFGILPLPFAVVGHEGSTVIVILNGLTLLKGPPREL